MELSPRTAPTHRERSPPRRRRSPWAYGALVLVLVGIGVVAYQALSSASLYFYNADEAVEQKAAELGDQRFRVQGWCTTTSSRGPTATASPSRSGTTASRCPVEHDGDPPELFEPGIPVVLEGHWAGSGEAFKSDRILVKHSEEYQAENGDRLDDAEDGETADSTTP